MYKFKNTKYNLKKVTNKSHIELPLLISIDFEIRMNVNHKT